MGKGHSRPELLRRKRYPGPQPEDFPSLGPCLSKTVMSACFQAHVGSLSWDHICEVLCTLYLAPGLLFLEGSISAASRMNYGRFALEEDPKENFKVGQSKVLRHKLGINQTVFPKDIPRMPEAHGKARLENQVKMLIMGKKMLETSQKGGEGAREAERDITEYRENKENARAARKPLLAICSLGALESSWQHGRGRKDKIHCGKWTPDFQDPGYF
ncbi:hypothetical protein E5288_WYG007828 [Bos mutus]|uniref:Uncharacterized protein n=1 Tax=Bos mutus TaxID=72004 RepID=A0A6B0RP25_9CETA|nr:hypothetical protein [Bos mutus]